MRPRYFFLVATLLLSYLALSQGFTVLQTGPSLNVTRYGHAALSLPNGNVLVIGGHTTNFYTTNTAEIYNPTTNAWTLHTITNAHDMLAMARLNNGNYLFMGGCSSALGVGQSSVTTLYNPSTNTFTNGPTMLTSRTNSTAITLSNGNVLVVGNWYNTGNAELYDASTNQFVTVGAPPTERALALLLPADDGTAYILGGTGNYGGSFFTSVEKYNPSTNLITADATEIIPGESGWTTMWSASMPIIEDMRLSNGNYVFLLFKTVSGATSYRIGQFNPATKIFSIMETTPPIPDYTGATTDFAFSASLMIDPITDFIYLNAVKNTSLHEERMYTVNAQDSVLSVPAGQTAFSYYVYTGSKAWVNGGIMYTGGTNDGSNFNVNSEVKILSPTNTFNVEEAPVSVGKELFVFPNPVTGSSFDVYLKNLNCQEVIVYDLTGSVLKRIEVYSNEAVVTIQRQNLKPGVYIIEAKSRTKRKLAKFIIQ